MYLNRIQLLKNKESLIRQLNSLQDKLNYWREQKAQSGLLVPYEIINGIKEAGEEIERTEAKIEKIDEQLKTSPVEEMPSVNFVSRKKRSTKATGIIVIPTLIVAFQLRGEAQEIVKNELSWLFIAADHLFRVRQMGLDWTTPVPAAIPSQAELSSAANNTILGNINESHLQEIEEQIKDIIMQINEHLDVLNLELLKEAEQGGSSDAAVKNSINKQLRAIVTHIQELTELMKQVFGIMIFSPNELADLMI